MSQEEINKLKCIAAKAFPAPNMWSDRWVCINGCSFLSNNKYAEDWGYNSHIPDHCPICHSKKIMKK